MSKETFARGFCKVAKSNGVDPVTLAKYAQQYKTEGYAPHMEDPFKGEVNIPYISSSWGEIYGGSDPKLHSLTNGGVIGNRDMNDDLKARMALNPKFKNWVDAHTNAVQKAVAPLKAIKYPESRKFPSDISDMLEKLYHDEMRRTTSAPPAWVEAARKTLRPGIAQKLTDYSRFARKALPEKK